MVKGLIYLSLPMRGYFGSNFEHGDVMKTILTSQDWVVISPCDMDRAEGITGADTESYDDSLVEQLMRRDITALLTVNAAYFCAGWEDSRGCSVEHAIARGIGLRCFYEKPRDDDHYAYSWAGAMRRED